METKNMTVGNPAKLIIFFAMPLMLGNVFQQLYTFVDTMIVGKALGINALAALGATEWLTFMLFGTVQGMIQGFSVVMAQRFGANDNIGLRKSVANAIYLSLAVAIIFTIVGQIMIEPVLKLLETPNQIMELSVTYLRIIYMGIPITITYNLSAAILRSLGNSKTPLKAMTIASIVNIILDLLFIFILKWGIEGAAVATLLAQVFSAVFCLLKLREVELLKFHRKELSGDRELCLRQLKTGVPMGLQNMITAIGGLVVQTVINGFGILFIAGFTAANKLYGLLEIAASSYGYAMTTYTGQNMGAKNYKRIRTGLFMANGIGVITALMMSTIMILGGKTILGCFLAGNEATIRATIKIGYQFLMILAIFFPLLYILYIIRSCIQGVGNTVLPMISSIIQLLMRTGCALILPVYIGENGVFWGEVFAWTGADIFLMLSYFYLIRKLK